MPSIDLAPGERIIITKDTTFDPDSSFMVLPTPDASEAYDLIDLLNQANEVTGQALTPKDVGFNVDSEYPDLFHASNALVGHLLVGWPRTAPTLDEVRNGKAPIDGHPHPALNLPPLREALIDVVVEQMPIKVKPERVDAFVDAILELLRRRQRARKGVVVDIETRTVDGVPTIAYAGIRHPTIPEGRKVQNPSDFYNRVKGTTVRHTIITKANELGGTFTVEKAEDWLEALGYHRSSATPACSDLMQCGYLKRVSAGMYRALRQPTPDELRADLAVLKEMRDERNG